MGDIPSWDSPGRRSQRLLRAQHVPALGTQWRVTPGSQEPPSLRPPGELVTGSTVWGLLWACMRTVARLPDGV